MLVFLLSLAHLWK